MSDYKGFSRVKLTRPTKSTFDLTHDKRLSTRMGRLTPVLIQEALPSDYFSGSSEMLVRLAPLLAPIYDQIQVYVHFFFVPCRLLWQDWEEFITGGRLGVGIDPVAAPIPPYINIGDALAENPNYFAESRLPDYLGCPIWPFDGDIADDYEVCQLDVMPFAAYQCIIRDYYRDRNFAADSLWDYLPMPSSFQTNFVQLLTIGTRNYKHDYFTSALPFTQRGVEVLMPLAGTGSVTYYDQSRVVDDGGGLTTLQPLGTQDPGIGPDTFGLGAGTGSPNYQNSARIENIDEVTLDSSDISINDFRSAYALQVWLERNAIAGSRYVESNVAHFGDDPRLKQDARLQRAEYICGGRIPVKISEVVSTAFSSDGSDVVPLANMGGHGVTYGNTNQFKYFCPEHGFIIGILSIMNPPSYHQGLPRMFVRKTFLDYPWPTFAKLGEQQVNKFEIYADAANMTEAVDGSFPMFGYQSRYSDWKYAVNSNHGSFHSTLMFWTLTREFADSPELGYDFNLFDINVQNRIFAVNQEVDNFWLYIHNKVSVKRPLPYFGTPNTLGFS